MDTDGHCLASQAGCCSSRLFVRSACCCLSSRVHGTNVLESDKNSPAAIPHDTKCHLQYPWIMGTAEFSGCHIDGKYVIICDHIWVLGMAGFGWIPLIGVPIKHLHP